MPPQNDDLERALGRALTALFDELVRTLTEPPEPQPGEPVGATPRPPDGSS